MFDAGRRFFAERPDVSGEQLYAFMVSQAEAAGWEFGGTDRLASGRAVPARAHRGREGRVLHRPGQRPADAPPRRQRPGLPLDPRGSPGGPGAV